MLGGIGMNNKAEYTPEKVVDISNLSREDWLEYRKKGIGGSDVAAIMGISPFATIRDLFYNKTGVQPVIQEEEESNWVAKEVGHRLEDLVAEIKAGIAKGKKHAIVAITEHMCDVDELASYIEKETGRETRATVLGHIQRGGSPVPYDRILASRMGAYAIELLLQGHGGRCVGIQNEKLVHHDIIDAIENMKRPFKNDWLDCAKKLY